MYVTVSHCIYLYSSIRICISNTLYIPLQVNMYRSLSICIYLYTSICMDHFQSVYTSTRQYVWITINLCIPLHVNMYGSLSICVYLYTHLYVSLCSSSFLCILSVMTPDLPAVTNTPQEIRD